METYFYGHQSPSQKNATVDSCIAHTFFVLTPDLDFQPPASYGHYCGDVQTSVSRLTGGVSTQRICPASVSAWEGLVPITALLTYVQNVKVTALWVSWFKS